MTIVETKKIIAVMLVSYPNFKPSDVDSMADTWSKMLSEYSYSQVSMALKAYILSDTSGFAPSIGQLVAKIQSVAQPQELSEMEAWSLVSKAIRNSSYNSVEEFAKLPPLVQKTVGLPGQLRTWALDENYNEQVVSSNFIKCYRNEVSRQEELNKMPVEVKALINNILNKSYSAQIEEKRNKAINSSSKAKENKIEALEAQKEYIPMPCDIKKKLEEFKNE